MNSIEPPKKKNIYSIMFKNPEILRNFEKNCLIAAEIDQGSRGLFGLVDIPAAQVERACEALKGLPRVGRARMLEVLCFPGFVDG